MHKYWEKHLNKHSVDLDQTGPKEQSDLGLHCLPFSSHSKNTQIQKQKSIMGITGSKVHYGCGLFQ